MISSAQKTEIANQFCQKEQRNKGDRDMLNDLSSKRRLLDSFNRGKYHKPTHIKKLITLLSVFRDYKSYTLVVLREPTRSAAGLQSIIVHVHKKERKKEEKCQAELQTPTVSDWSH